jgi:serine/threonine-protein kinase
MAARVPGLEIHRDEVEVSEATWGVAVPLDPGEHVIVAKAPGKKDWSQTVHVDARGAPIVVEVPLLENVQVPKQQQPAEKADVTKAPVTDAMNGQGRGNSQRTLAYVVSGVGVVGWLVGAVAGLEAKSKQKQSESQCLTSAPIYCNQQGVDLLDTGRSYAAVANVGFVVGAVGVVGGALLYFTSPSASVPTTALTNFERLKHGVSITPTIDAKSQQLWVTGSF